MNWLLRVKHFRFLQSSPRPYQKIVQPPPADKTPHATRSADGIYPTKPSRRKKRSSPLISISVIIPTLREAQNIPHLLHRLAQVREANGLDLEVLLLDDDSRDGSVEAVKAAGYSWASIIVRKSEPGLSQSVVEGLSLAKHPILVCMDGDLSHPPEAIPRLLDALERGFPFVLGSRYVAGGSTDDRWGWLRWFGSRLATWLVRPITDLKDPMAGFFAIRKTDFDNARDLNPMGYKIALELIVKCDFKSVAEVPICFSDRVRGQSKLGLRQQLLYVRHVGGLYLYSLTHRRLRRSHINQIP
jgi:dolichol-phosphate mannosyltransferase